MAIANFRVEPADYKADFEDLRTIWESVFVSEQTSPEGIEFEPGDPSCYHAIARDDQHKAIGTGRLSPDRKIGPMAVLENWRGKGVGKAILGALLHKARLLGFPDVTLGTQSAALGFFEKFGFSKEGDVSTDTNSDRHLIRLRLQLEPMSKAGRPAPKPGEPLVEISETNTLQGLILASRCLIDKARKEIYIYTPNLEPTLYGNQELVEALKQFAIGSGGGNIMIIVQEPLAARSQPHPLLDLAQRLPSIFLFRTPVEAEDLQYPSAYLVNDRDGYLFRQQGHMPLGVWSPTLPARNRQLSEEFERVWQRSRPCTEFRALGL